MNIEDIKIGETYNVRMKVTYKEKDQVCVKNPMVSVYGCDYMIVSHKYIHPTTEQPKYDPCRPFRKGDRVRVVERNGRKTPSSLVIEDLYEKTLTVIESEDSDDDVLVATSKGSKYIKFYFLELVTPVEELEPYFIEETEYEYCVTIMVGERKDTPATYHKRMHPHAKEAAEAECARLNAEHRKEQK